MSPRTPRTLAVLVLAAAAAVLPVAVSSVPSAHAAVPTGYCSLDNADPSLDPFVWTGNDDNGQWSDAGNWLGGVVPENESADGYVCIDAANDLDLTSNVVEIDLNIDARVQAFDIQAGTTLVLEEGAKLFTYGDHTTRPSRLRAGSATLVAGATLGGPGRIDLAGTLTWRALPSGGATIVSDPACFVDPACVPVGTPGLLAVGDAATLRVDGRGVNLEDRYTLLVRGRMVLSNAGYVAADRGTSIQLRPRAGTGAGVLDIANAGSIFEGRPMGLPDTQLATFVNQGLVLKRAPGVSAINARYSVVGAGRVEVRAGTLTLPSGQVGSATVSRGQSYGTGTCTEAVACTPQTTAADRQFGRFQAPRSGPSRLRVTVAEQNAKMRAADVAPPIRFHAPGLRRGRVAVLTLRYDATALGARTRNSLRVIRVADGTTRRQQVPNCRSRGRFPAGARSCVWKRQDVGATGDVQVLVRTQVTSRWIGR